MRDGAKKEKKCSSFFPDLQLPSVCQLSPVRHAFLRRPFFPFCLINIENKKMCIDTIAAIERKKKKEDQREREKKKKKVLIN